MPPRTRPRILSYKYTAVAAVVGLVIGGAAVFTFIKKKEKPVIAAINERFKNDVAPGSGKAILELADGRRITLDSAANGQLVQQGSTRVIKAADGQLSYEAAAHRSPAAGIALNTVSTPRGGQYQVILPDGSKVWLNAASSLRFPTAFTGSERKVELTGEAYFEVADNAAMPFKVKMATVPGKPEGAAIEVLGTHFNVMGYADEDVVKTTLLEGRVKVIPGGAHQSWAILSPGQQASISPLLSQASVHTVDTSEVIAWKNGLLQFREANIQSIMRQVSRWYNVEVVYEGKIEQQFYGKIPRRVPVSTVLKILESTGWVHFTINGKKITVAP
jgi:ferric-dicitrate binding protein FerR (iron transport regulator)